MTQAQQMQPPPDGLGAVNPDLLTRYNPAELAQTIGGYREMWHDLGGLVKDLDAVGMIADGSAHPWAPMVMHRLGHHITHGHHRGHGHMGHVVHQLLQRLHAVMARHVNLERERQLWHAKSNVVETAYWQGVPAGGLSSTATMRAPYSGVNYMILDCLMDTALTPFGFWTNISFASINFAQAGSTISYAPPVVGTGGTQTVGGGGMGFNVFLQDKTAPDGCRGWNPWTGWILSSDAVSTWQWANADVVNPRSLSVDVLMRSSPCETANWGQGGRWGEGQSSIPWAGYHYGSDPQIGTHALNMMYAGVLGLHGLPQGHPTTWFQGQHMTHPGSYGSVGPGAGIVPSGHGGPFGPHLT